MKVSKAQATENRDAILSAAASQIRERGLDQMNVNEVARDAGLTHGALYSHFSSKDALKAAATESAFDETVRAFTGLSMDQFLGRYLSPQHRDNPAMGCPNAALVSEVWRQPSETQKIFRDGLQRFVALTDAALERGGNAPNRDKAIALFATLVGGLALSRAIRDVDKAGSEEILHAVAGQTRAFVGLAPATAI
jgi:TetR/AcrR family transcriptional repressor of nem operon